MPDTESEVAEFTDEESTASSVSTCDYSDTDVESACSDFDVHTTNRYTQINSCSMESSECTYVLYISHFTGHINVQSGWHPYQC